MNKYFFLLFSLFCVTSFAQENDNSKYLGDVIPIVDGKVVFSKEIQAPGLSAEQVYVTMLEWAETRFNMTNGAAGKVLYTNQEEGQIACKGEEFIVFTNRALVLDRSKMHYRTTITCKAEKCKLEISNIYYIYPEVNGVRIPAEEQITDANSLNKKKTKLLRLTGKFRVKTVDLVEGIFEGAQNALAVKSITTPPATIPKNLPVTEIRNAPVASGESIAGYTKIDANNIPGNIIELLNESWSLITAGDDEEFNMMTASWGGIGCLYGKPVSFCFINPARYTYQLMEKGDYYTISFYTEDYREALNYCGRASGRDADKVKESGLTPLTFPSKSKAFSEAWLILECKKMVAQPISHEGMYDDKLKANWEGKDTHKMYIGEIINVWTK